MQVYEPLRTIGMALEPTGADQTRERTVVREVCYALTDVREEFTVRRSKLGAPARVCRHAIYFHSQDRGGAVAAALPADSSGVSSGSGVGEGSRGALLAPSRKSELTQLRQCFSTLDRNGSGTVTIDELRTAFGLVGVAMSAEEVCERACACTPV